MQFLFAVWEHAKLQLTGGIIAIVFLLWSHIARKEIPDAPFWALVLLALFWATFRAWNEEHLKVAVPEAPDPEIEFRRQQFEEEIAKLSPNQEPVLRYVVRVGDSDAMQLREFLHERGQDVSLHEADMLLTGIAETTHLLEVRSKGNTYNRYATKPVWTKLLIEWAAPPTPTDSRIADIGRDLRRMLKASSDKVPPQPKFDDLTRWASQLSSDMKATEATLQDMVRLRADASRRVERDVGVARDAYYHGVGAVNQLFSSGALSISTMEQQAAVDQQLRGALAQIRNCIATVDRITAS